MNPKQMYKQTSLALLGYLLFVFASCSEQDASIPDVSSIEIDLEIVRLDQEMFQQKNEAEMASFLDKYPKVAERYFHRSSFNKGKTLAAELLSFVKFPANDTLLSDVNAAFGDFSQIAGQLETAFRFVKFYYPEFNPPKVYTTISGFGAFGQDIFLEEDLLVISLDFFAGPQATYRPSGIPHYILRRYSPEYIVPTVMTFLSSEFNAYESSDKSLLADMIFYGKALYFTEKTLPLTPDTLLIGFSEDEYLGCYANQNLIWGHFVENDLFYETGNFKKNKYVGERPAVLEIGDKCPGRVGRWLGWEIIRRYMEENPEMSFQQLMAKSNAQEIFQASRYKPERLNQ